MFLALAIGLLVGTAALDQTLVDQLQAQTQQSEERLQDALSELEAASRQLEATDEFMEAVLPGLSTGRLADERVVLVTVEGVDGEAVGEARQALELAGAEIVTQLWATARIAAATEEDRSGIATILAVDPGMPVPDLIQQAARDLAARLVEGPGRAEEDLLGELLAEGFLESRSPPIGEADLARIGGRTQILLVVGGGEASDLVPPEGFLVPLTLQLVRDGARVAAGEGARGSASFVSALRERDGEVPGAQFVTVDDLDLGIGGAALVLGLEDLVAVGRGGHYGIAPDAADGVAPRI